MPYLPAAALCLQWSWVACPRLQRWLTLIVTGRPAQIRTALAERLRQQVAPRARESPADPGAVSERISSTSVRSSRT